MSFVLFGLAVAVGIMLLFGGTEVDRGLLMLVSRVDAPRLKEVAGVIVSAAHPLVLAALTLAGSAWLLARRQWREALLLSGVVLSGWMVIDLLQQVTAAIRPGPDDRLLASQVTGGFPDALVARATLVLIALPLLIATTRPLRPVLGTTGGLLVLAIGWARILRGESWPSDVIGAWGVGVLWVLLPLRLAGHDIGDGAPRRRRPPPNGEPDQEKTAATDIGEGQAPPR